MFLGGSLASKTLEWKEQFGPVFTIYLGRRPTVVIANIEAMTEAYHTGGDDFADKPRMTSLDLISENGSDIAFADMSDALKYRRKIVMQVRVMILEQRRQKRDRNGPCPCPLSGGGVGQGGSKNAPKITFLR